MAVRRVTRPTLRVIDALRKDLSGDHWGYRLARETHLAPGTVQPILTRLESEGWLESWWEEIDPRREGRRPRRLYRVTGTGARAIQQIWNEHGYRVRSVPPVIEPSRGGAT